jgi:uncharacterized protein (TIGR03066 family)
MNVLRLSGTVLGCFALTAFVAAAAPAPDKKATNKEKIVGVWAPTKKKDGAPVPTLEFTEKGKLKITINANGKEIKIDGTYSVKDDKLTVTMKGPDGKDHKETMTIKELTKDKLVTVDSKNKEETFEKKNKK